ncbi:FKBP-type peptidyl-prolyl cis-trans isomerase [Cellulomonas hominis]
MRRLAATTLALVLLLAGCSSSDDSSPDPTSSTDAPAADATASAADIAALAAVEVAGDAGAAPTLTFDQPFSVSAAVARVATPGTGDTIADGQVVTFNYIAVSGTDGSQLGTTYGADPESFTLSQGSLVAPLYDALVDEQVGARVLFAAPGADETTLMALEVTAAKTVPSRAEGEAVAPADGLPAVTLAADGQPSITTVDADAPTDLVTQVLIKGAGATVESGQTITVQYSGWLWDGTPFDSSWENGSSFTTSIGTGAVVPGWDTGLVGQTVGSQVLLVIPPDQAYRDAGSGSIPGGSTLIFVVDILDAS